MKHLKIAIVNEICVAGATRCARDLEKHLSSSHVVRYYPKDETKKETIHSLLNDLAEFAPDVVHCHSYYGDLPYRALQIIASRYPTCFTPHDPRPLGTPHPSDTMCWDCPRSHACFRCARVSRLRKLLLLNPYFWHRLYKRYIHFRLPRHIRIISPSRWLQQRLLASEWRHFSIDYIPNGIDLEDFREVKNARVQLGISDAEKIILYVAFTGKWALNGRKGLYYLSEAFFQKILPTYPDAKLYVAGEGLIPNHPNVVPLGFLSQEILPLYYSAADVFAVPTLADNLPYTILEAMSCSTPVVGSRVGGIPEQIEEDVTGYLVPRGDIKALGEALLHILHDRKMRDAMGRASRARVENIFSMAHFIRQHETLYQELQQTTASVFHKG
ncbi:glycosyl transferase, group 1/2 family protein [Candidatus Moduliflexus flocculans]|uniref:Glycosyl transferase, group 1/2 family protein n=1 Tax=Candidatus Moduliflexus flocculans TaxID=1499966 RepID=A0A0S6VT48_9BACT|nr:glycosyl transferase, group 1/2 family protein [Candidatus Moduliflexus flocculans]